MKAIGFVVLVEDGEAYLRIESYKTSDMEASLMELSNAIEMLAPDKNISSSFLEEKKTSEGDVIRQNSSVSTASADSSTGRMSEKQKARLLMEKKRRKEIEEAKVARKRTTDLIKQGEIFENS